MLTPVGGSPREKPPAGIRGRGVWPAIRDMADSKSGDEDSPWLYFFKPYEFDIARIRELYGGGRKQL